MTNIIENHRFPSSRTSEVLEEHQGHLGWNHLSRNHKRRKFSGNVPVTETRDFSSLWKLGEIKSSLQFQRLKKSPSGSETVILFQAQTDFIQNYTFIPRYSSLSPPKQDSPLLPVPNGGKVTVFCILCYWSTVKFLVHHCFRIWTSAHLPACQFFPILKWWRSFCSCRLDHTVFSCLRFDGRLLEVQVSGINYSLSGQLLITKGLVLL